MDNRIDNAIDALNFKIGLFLDDLASGRVSLENYYRVVGNIRGLKMAVEILEDAEDHDEEDD